MSDPLGLSIGTTNLVAARVGNRPVIRRSILTLSSDRTPQVGAPPLDGHPPDARVLSGFVERVGDPVPLVAEDGSSYPAERLLVEALDAMIEVSGPDTPREIAVAVPAYWGTSTLWALRNALRTNPNLAPNGVPARLVPDSVAALTALQANPGLGAHGVVALLDFGGGGTSITLADAASAFEPVDETVRYPDFSGDQIDQALLMHVLGGVADAGAVDPAGTAAVGSLARLREQCRLAKERLSADTATDLVAELPGYRSGVRITRAELERLIAEPLAGVLRALDNALERNRISWPTVSAVVTVGGGASIPLVTQRLSEHSRAPLVTTPQPALDAALGAAVYAAGGAIADAPTGVAPAAEAPTGVAPAAPIGGGEPGSATFRALAWSQGDDADEPVPYTDENPYAPENPYASPATAGRPPVQYVPSDPLDETRPWQRLPQLVVGLAAVVALVAVGGVAYALTGMTGTESSTPTESARPTTAQAPPPAPVETPAPAPPPPPVETVVSEPPPPPPVTITQAPVTTTHVYVTTTTPPTTTTVPTTTTTTATTTTTTTVTTTTTATTPPTTTVTTVPTTTTTVPTNPMTTTYITVPFVPVPIPIQVPQNPFQPPSP